MNKIPMLERFAAQSLVEHDGELIFSKEKFAELIVRECANIVDNHPIGEEDLQYKQIIVHYLVEVQEIMQLHFGV